MHKNLIIIIIYTMLIYVVQNKKKVEYIAYYEFKLSEVN